MAIRSTRLGPGKLTITSTNSGLNHEFSSQVRSATVEPKVKRDDPLEVLSGEKMPGDRTETWTLKGALIDDFGTAGSSVEYCFTNRGKEATFAFVPSTAAGKKVSGKIVIEATSIGGDVGKTNEVDFEFEVIDPAIGAAA